MAHWPLARPKRGGVCQALTRLVPDSVPVGFKGLMPKQPQGQQRQRWQRAEGSPRIPPQQRLRQRRRPTRGFAVTRRGDAQQSLAARPASDLRVTLPQTAQYGPDLSVTLPGLWLPELSPGLVFNVDWWAGAEDIPPLHHTRVSQAEAPVLHQDPEPIPPRTEERIWGLQDFFLLRGSVTRGQFFKDEELQPGT